MLVFAGVVYCCKNLERADGQNSLDLHQHLLSLFATHVVPPSKSRIGFGRPGISVQVAPHEPVLRIQPTMFHRSPSPHKLAWNARVCWLKDHQPMRTSPWCVVAGGVPSTRSFRLGPRCPAWSSLRCQYQCSHSPNRKSEGFSGKPVEVPVHLDVPLEVLVKG